MKKRMNFFGYEGPRLRRAKNAVIGIGLGVMAGISSAIPTLAQPAPVHNQYVINPYIYNPAAVGAGQHTQFYTSVRKQWLGTEGAPTVATLTFELPRDRGLSFGARLVNVSEGPFNSFQPQVTAGYRVPLSQRPTQSLSFGLSLGVSLNTFRSDRVDDPDDPALAAYRSSRLVPDGAFGVQYRYERVQIGLAAPRLSGASRYGGDYAPTVRLRPWDRLLVSVAYQLTRPRSPWQVTPQVLYHYDADFTNQVEVMTLVRYNKKAWGGLGYRQQYGLNVTGGGRINEMLQVSYVYSLPNQNYQGAPSHELVLGVRLVQP